MKLAPFSIAKLMVVVVAVAINLAIVRLLAAYSPVLPVAVAWTGLALQAGGLAVILGRGRALSVLGRIYNIRRNSFGDRDLGDGLCHEHRHRIRSEYREDDHDNDPRIAVVDPVE